MKQKILSLRIGDETVGDLFKIPANQGNIKCALCDHITAFRQVHIGHICKHININPIKCIFCEKTYNRKSSLKVHVKMFHYINELIWFIYQGSDSDRTSNGIFSFQYCNSCFLMIKSNLLKLSNGMLCRNVQHCWLIGIIMYEKELY